VLGTKQPLSIGDSMALVHTLNVTFTSTAWSAFQLGSFQKKYNAVLN